jgi:hypothetical protein
MADGAIQGPRSRYCPFIGEYSNALRKKLTALLEALLIHLLDVQGFLDPATHAVTDHQAR